MPWNVQLHPQHPIIETAYAGLLPPAELTAAALRTLEMAKLHDTHLLLGDCSTLEGGHTALDLYELANFLSAAGIAGILREAVLLPALPLKAEDVQFWETICLNRGLLVRIFEDRQEAIDWLLS